MLKPLEYRIMNEWNINRPRARYHHCCVASWNSSSKSWSCADPKCKLEVMPPEIPLPEAVFDLAVRLNQVGSGLDTDPRAQLHALNHKDRQWCKYHGYDVPAELEKLYTPAKRWQDKHLSELQPQIMIMTICFIWLVWTLAFTLT